VYGHCLRLRRVGKVSARRVLVSNENDVLITIIIKCTVKAFQASFFFFFFCGVQWAAISLRWAFNTVNEFIYVLTPFVLVLVGLLFLGSICASVLTV
jgi:hypothetical protein